MSEKILILDVKNKEIHDFFYFFFVKMSFLSDQIHILAVKNQEKTRYSQHFWVKNDIFEWSNPHFRYKTQQNVFWLYMLKKWSYRLLNIIFEEFTSPPLVDVPFVSPYLLNFLLQRALNFWSYSLSPNLLTVISLGNMKKRREHTPKVRMWTLQFYAQNLTKMLSEGLLRILVTFYA